MPSTISTTGTQYGASISGSGGPASMHAADLDTYQPHGWARSLCGRTVSVDHDMQGRAVAALPIGSNAERFDAWDDHRAESVSCLVCSRALARIEAETPGSVEVTDDDIDAAALGLSLDRLHALDATAVSGSVWACTDCTLYLVNGESPTEQDDTEAARWSAAVGESIRTMTLVPFDFDESDTEPSTVAAVRRWGSGRREFSWDRCGVCGSTLGGERHRFSIDAD